MTKWSKKNILKAKSTIWLEFSAQGMQDSTYISGLHTIITTLIIIIITSGQCSLTTGRIAAAHRRFNCIRQVAPVCTPPTPLVIHASLGPPEFKSQTASRSVPRFSRLHSCTSQRPPFPLKIDPSFGGSEPPSNTWFLGPRRVLDPDSISIGSAIFAQLTAEHHRGVLKGV